MARTIYRHFRQVRLSSHGVSQPWIQGVEVIWIGAQGQVTYWDENGRTLTRHLHRSPLSMFTFSDLLLRDDVIDVPVQRRQPIPIWAALTRRMGKWAQRVRSAGKALWQELTRED